MTRKEVESRITFERYLIAEVEDKNIGHARHTAALLCRHGRTYARIQEAICSGVEWSQYDTNETFNKRQARHEKWTEKREQQLEKRMREICAGLGAGFVPVFSGDPRGVTVKVQVPSGKTDDWGKEGICVPTA